MTEGKWINDLQRLPLLASYPCTGALRGRMVLVWLLGSFASACALSVLACKPKQLTLPKAWGQLPQNSP